MRVTHLADSDILIDFLKGRLYAVDVLSPLIQKDVLATSLFSYAEVFEGLVHLGLEYDIEEIGRGHGLFQSLPMILPGNVTAKYFARLRLRLRRAGRLIPDQDLWIGATAAEHGLRLVTNDAHFDRLLGVHVVHPKQT